MWKAGKRAFGLSVALVVLSASSPATLSANQPEVLGATAAGASAVATRASGSAATKVFPRDQGTYLQCADIKRRVRDFVRTHYSFESFSEELSVRTWETFLRYLDPGKGYLLASDVAAMESFKKALPAEVQSGRCDFIYQSFNIMLQRMDDSLVIIRSILAKPFDYTLDESIEIDRSKLAWATSNEELRERWYKTLKFMNMGMEDTEKDNKVNVERLIKRYERDRKNFSERTTDEIHALFLNAFAAALDPHSSYFKPVDQEEFRINFALELVGIGATLSQRDGYTIVQELIPGGAAARDGRLKKDDKIILVDPGTGEGPVDVVDMDLGKVVQFIRGKKGTTVKLTILRKEASGEPSRHVIALERDVVKLADGEAKSDVMKVGNKTLGVVNLPTFYLDYQGSQRSSGDYRSSARDVQREIAALKKKNVDGIILDLRSNGGGDLSECQRLTGMFIEGGPVVQIQDRDRRVSSLDDPTPGSAVYDGPLLLLLNKQSASASEIIAGALQDYGRAIIAGNSRTYGKGTVQHVIDVPGRSGRPSDGAIKVTISKFFMPSGRSNQEIGVASDLTIPNVLDVFDFSEAKQDYVLKTSTIRPHRQFKPIIDWKPVLGDLKKQSQVRLEKAPEWKDTFESVAEATKEKERTTLSLKREAPASTQDKAKAEAKKSKRTPSGDDDEDIPARGERKVVRADDLELAEAGRILVDAMALTGDQKSWLQPVTLKKSLSQSQTNTQPTKNAVP
jgi:carboxyl-terminal processing protease